VSTLRVIAVADNFGRDLSAGFARVAVILERARALGAGLVVFPEATLGGYLAHLEPSGPPDLPPAFDPAGPEIAELARLAGDLVVCAGYCEGEGVARYNAAVCVSGDGVLGHHRKVHHPLSEGVSYDTGDRFRPFDTPVGRLGMMICYDKAFPEAARTLAMDGATIGVCMSAWPTAKTLANPDIAQDRWKKRFDLFDQACALENQIVWVSANQAGTFGSLRFVGSAKIVDPGGEILANTGVGAGLAVAGIDVEASLEAARRYMGHLRDRRPHAYGALAAPADAPARVWA